MDMLLECSIFISVNADTGNYYQLSGVPVHEVKSDEHQKSNIARVNADKEAPTKLSLLKIESKKPGAITFVRTRMLYAKAALNAKGGVRFGMRHIRAFQLFFECFIETNFICRCSQSIHQSRRQARDSTYHAVYLPPSIRLAQRLHFQGGSA